MADVGDERAARRARWRSYFEQTLLGGDREVLAATEAAMDAVDRGLGQQEIIAAGRAAAKRVRGGGPGAGATSRPPRGASGMASDASAPRNTQARDTSGSRAKIYPATAGVVSVLEKRTESLDGQFFQVWSCRVMRLQAGQPVGPAIPVEIRGRSIIGQLTQGDVIEIPEGRPGQTRLVKEIRNLSTEAMIEAKGRPFRRSRTLRRTWRVFAATMKTLLGLAAVAALVVIAYYMLHQMDIITWEPDD